MRILIDMDGVCADMLGGLLPLFNRYYGTKLTHADIKDWDLTRGTGLDKAQVYGLLHEPGFFRHLPVIPGAIEAINLLSQDHEIVFVTACAYGHEDKAQWIRRHFPQFDTGKNWIDNLIFASRKELVIGDVLLDDNPEHLESFRDMQGMEAVCFDQPYNQHYVGKRVRNWEEFVDLVITMEAVAA